MTNRTLIIIGAIVVVLAFLGGMALQKGRNTEETPTPTPTVSPSVSATPTPTPVTYIIRRTDSGVTPKSLTIQVGDTVRFINDGTSDWWPASDPHPTHTLCPGFDARRALQQGESYELTFEQARTCTYHNHVAPADAAQQGTIIVQ